MGIADTDLLDLLQTTTARLPWDGKFSVLQKKQNYPGLNDFLVNRHITEEGGTTLDWRVQYRDNGQAKATHINAETSPTILNTMIGASLPWRQYETNWTTNRQEMLRNRSTPKLINLVKTRREAGMMSLANLLEEHMWTAIPLTSDDEVLFPVDYWLPKRATSAADSAGGFDGQNPKDAAGTSFPNCAGIDASSTTYALWKSYQARWTANTSGELSKSDISRMRKMYHMLKFEAPRITDGPKAPGRKLSYYCNLTTMLSMEDAGDSRNDRLGFDIARVAETMTFKGVPIRYVSQLDSDTSYPLYAINHEIFKVVVLKGDYFRESSPIRDVKLHNTYTTFVDLTCQTRVENRQRCGGVISYQ